jgi:hypothetical protein
MPAIGPSAAMENMEILNIVAIGLEFSTFTQAMCRFNPSE